MVIFVFLYFDFVVNRVGVCFKIVYEFNVYWLYSWCLKFEFVKYMYWNGNCLL